MAPKMNGRTKRLALGALLGACAISLAGCGQSAHDRELEEQLAASKMQDVQQQKKLAVETPEEAPQPMPPANAQSEGDSPDAVSGDDNSSFGDVTDPDSGSDKFDNDLSSGMDSPNDFPAPADPPLAGDLSPDEGPQGE